MEKAILLTYSFIFGAIVGSFLNVCIYRIPKEMTLLGRSYCPQCKTLIPLYRNIPILSFLLQKGQSACCKKPISFQYPVIEFLTGLLSLATLLHFGRLSQNFIPLTANPLIHYFIWFLCFICPLIVITFIDMRHMIIPDVISLPFIGVGIAIQIFEQYPDFLTAFKISGLGILIGGGSLLLLAEIISRIKKVDAMGGGDIKLTAMLGAFLGIKAIVFIFFVSSVIALFYFVLIKIRKQAQKNQQIPFGPFLSLAAMIYFLYGRELTHLYFGSFGLKNPFFP